MNSKKIFAIVGMKGSGKSETVKYLREKYQWPKIYLPQALFDEIEKKGMPLNWESEKYMRAHLRQEHGFGVFGTLALPKIKELLADNDIILLESLYSWDEYKIIKGVYPEYFKALAIFTPSALRLERLKNRDYRPVKTRKEFDDIDWHELESTDKGGPIAIADYTIVNDGSVENLHQKIDEIIKKELS